MEFLWAEADLDHDRSLSFAEAVCFLNPGFTSAALKKVAHCVALAYQAASPHAPCLFLKAIPELADPNSHVKTNIPPPEGFYTVGSSPWHGTAHSLQTPDAKRYGAGNGGLKLSIDNAGGDSVSMTPGQLADD